MEWVVVAEYDEKGGCTRWSGRLNIMEWMAVAAYDGKGGWTVVWVAEYDGKGG
jgi:hypothetical protein